MKPTPDMPIEMLDALRNYWTQELQRTFFPERGGSRSDASTCEAYLREIDSVIKTKMKNSREKVDTGKSALPFNVKNPMFFVDKDDEE